MDRKELCLTRISEAEYIKWAKIIYDDIHMVTLAPQPSTASIKSKTSSTDMVIVGRHRKAGHDDDLDACRLSEWIQSAPNIRLPMVQRWIDLLNKYPYFEAWSKKDGRTNDYEYRKQLSEHSVTMQITTREGMYARYHELRSSLARVANGDFACVWTAHHISRPLGKFGLRNPTLYTESYYRLSQVTGAASFSESTSYAWHQYWVGSILNFSADNVHPDVIVDLSDVDLEKLPVVDNVNTDAYKWLDRVSRGEQMHAPDAILRQYFMPCPFTTVSQPPPPSSKNEIDVITWPLPVSPLVSTRGYVRPVDMIDCMRHRMMRPPLQFTAKTHISSHSLPNDICDGQDVHMMTTKSSEMFDALMFWKPIYSTDLLRQLDSALPPSNDWILPSVLRSIVLQYVDISDLLTPRGYLYIKD